MEKDKTNSKKAFRILKEVTGQRSVRTDVINDTDGMALTESVDILKRWEGYFGKLYKNQDGDTDNNCLDRRCDYEREHPPLRSEGKGTREHIFNIMIVIEKCREQNIPLYVCFIDYAKAFDCVSHRNLWDTMEQMGFPVHIIQLVANLYKE